MGLQPRLTSLNSGFVPEWPRKIRGASRGAFHGPRQSDQADGADRLPEVRSHPHVWDGNKGESAKARGRTRSVQSFVMGSYGCWVSQGNEDVCSTPCLVSTSSMCGLMNARGDVSFLSCFSSSYSQKWRRWCSSPFGNPGTAMRN